MNKLTYQSENDDFFGGNVHIEITPNEKSTECVVIVEYRGTPYENKRESYRWWVEISNKSIRDAEVALEILKDPYYETEGSSETMV